MKRAPFCLWLTGPSGAGKTTLMLELRKLDLPPFVSLDGDEFRTHVTPNLGFSLEDRELNIRMAAATSRLILKSGVSVIATFISPTLHIRSLAKSIIGEGSFLEVFVSTPLEVCKQRNTKGLYTRDVPNLTGVTSPYEPPLNPWLQIDTVDLTPSESASCILRALLSKGFV